MNLRCKKESGCHDCALSRLNEELRLFRAAIVQFLVEPSINLQRAKEEALAMKVKIDEWYEPCTGKELQDGVD